MKLEYLALALGIALTCQAQDSTIFNYTVANGTVPDNNPNGIQDTETVSGLSGPMANVTVTLGISGGFNGDLYAWLSHGSGLAILLNRVGISSSSSIGYANSGFGPNAQQVSFTLNDQAVQDVHFYQTGPFSLNTAGQLVGTWQPDGRNIDPDSAPASFDTAPRANMLGVFNGLNPNGNWTLFVADLSPGGVSTLNGWGMDITVVPEPAGAALLAMGIGVGLWRKK